MSMRTTSISTGAVAAAGVLANVAETVEGGQVDQLIARIKGSDEAVRAEAWMHAGKEGAAAVKPLVDLMSEADMEVARSAKRALWKIVRHVGRPGGAGECKPVVAELNKRVGADVAPAVGRELVWMLSEIGGDDSVKAIAPHLSNMSLREDARMALQRIPGNKATAALKAALASASGDFKPNLAHSLRRRGVTVSGYPSAKLTPSKPTKVKPYVPPPEEKSAPAK